MAINPLIPLSSRPPNFGQTVVDALDRKEARKNQNELIGIRRQESDTRRQVLDAQRGAAEAEAAERARLANLDSITAGALEVRPLLEDIENVPRAVKAIERRIQEIESRGGDASDSREVLEMIRSGNVAQARDAVDSAITVAERMGRIKPEPGQATTGNVKQLGAPIPGEKNGQQGVFATTLAPDGSITSQFIPAGEGVQFTNRQGETPSEQSTRTVETARGTTRAKEGEGRAQELINQGVEVADTAPTLRRTVELLDVVETGGVLNQAQLRFAQALGVETADQGELSANLGKAVLSQLRETFGAQFTEQEGKRLENIEANFGKNNETNKRLLRQALQIVERKAQRAIRLAEDRGDFETADVIQDALDATLGDQGQGTASQAQQGQVIDIDFGNLP